MDYRTVECFLEDKGSYFPKDELVYIHNRLLLLDDERSKYLLSMDFKSPVLALCISIFFGYLGLDRFYLGHIGWGVLKLITGGLFGLWTFIEWFRIMGITRRQNMKRLAPFLDVEG